MRGPHDDDSGGKESGVVRFYPAGGPMPDSDRQPGVQKTEVVVHIHHVDVTGVIQRDDYPQLLAQSLDLQLFLR